ncbi:hypothetical protein CesoFtcFv8_025681 [Champsocephalus esox]|nr:hypothetical protein CesoFtcFv8_025681 [Champsocephalus esox]
MQPRGAVPGQPVCSYPALSPPERAWEPPCVAELLLLQRGPFCWSAAGETEDANGSLDIFSPQSHVIINKQALHVDRRAGVLHRMLCEVVKQFA